MAKLTKEQFEQWLGTQRMSIYVDPYVIKPCSCGDINCKGWRLVAKAAVNEVGPPADASVERDYSQLPASRQ